MIVWLRNNWRVIIFILIVCLIAFLLVFFADTLINWLLGANTNVKLITPVLLLLTSVLFIVLFPVSKQRIRDYRKQYICAIFFFLFLFLFLILLLTYVTRITPVLNIGTITLSSITAIATVILALITFWYARSTKSMADQMHKQFELNYRPMITVSFSIKSNSAIYIVVKNEGDGAAKNIMLNITPPLMNSRGETIDKWPPLKNGIKYLAPKDVRTFFFDTSFSLFEKKDLPKDFTVHVEYDWAVGGQSKISEDIPLEISSYLGTDLNSFADVSTLIDDIRKIRELLEKQGK